MDASETEAQELHDARMARKKREREELAALRAEIARLRARPTEDEIAQTIWENVARLCQYEAITFEQIKSRTRHESLRKILGHATQRILSLFPKVQL